MKKTKKKFSYKRKFDTGGPYDEYNMNTQQLQDQMVNKGYVQNTNTLGTSLNQGAVGGVQGTAQTIQNSLNNQNSGGVNFGAMPVIGGLISTGQQVGTAVRSMNDKDKNGMETHTTKNEIMAGAGALFDPLSSIKEVQNSDLSRKDKNEIMLAGLFTQGIQGGVLYNKKQGELADKYEREQEFANMQANVFNNRPTSQVYEQGGLINEAFLIGLKSQMREGGNITRYQGPSHEQGGITIDSKTEVEGGETRGTGTTKDYIFSDKIMFDKKNTFADKSKSIEDKYSLRSNDKFSFDAKNKDLNDLMVTQELIRNNVLTEPGKYSKGGKLKKDYSFGEKLYIKNIDELDTKKKYAAGGDYDPFVNIPIDESQYANLTNPNDSNWIVNDNNKSEYSASPIVNSNTNKPNDFDALPTFKYNPNNKYNKPTRYNVGTQTWTNSPDQQFTNTRIRNELNDIQPGLGDEFMKPGFSEQYFDERYNDPKSKIYNSKYKNDRRFGIEHYNQLLSDAKSGYFNTTINDNTKKGPRWEVKNGDNQKDLTTKDKQVSNGVDTSVPENKLDIQYGDQYVPNEKKDKFEWVPYIGAAATTILGGISLNDKAKYDRANTPYIFAKHLNAEQAIRNNEATYNSFNESLRQNTGIGSYLSNRLVSAGLESKSNAGIYSNYDKQNKIIDNQTALQNAQFRANSSEFNANVQRIESDANELIKDNARNLIAQGITQGANVYMNQKRDKILQQQNDDYLRFAGGENFFFDPKSRNKYFIHPKTGIAYTYRDGKRYEYGTNREIKSF